MSKRIAMTAFIAAILGGAAYAVFSAPWFRINLFGYSDAYTFIDIDASNVLLQLGAFLVVLYFFVRLLMTGLLVFLGGPTSTGKIAWYTPAGAHLQGAFAFAATIVLATLSPDLSGESSLLTYERSWGGLLLVACAALAHVAIYLVARDSTLAKTQTWADDEGKPIAKPKRRWIRAAPAERPMIKSPPLPPSAHAAGDPFRGITTAPTAMKMVQPPTKIAPRVDDTNAPVPKLLT
jgi:hypothetical protein